MVVKLQDSKEVKKGLPTPNNNISPSLDIKLPIKEYYTKPDIFI